MKTCALGKLLKYYYIKTTKTGSFFKVTLKQYITSKEQKVTRLMAQEDLQFTEDFQILTILVFVNSLKC